MGNKRIMIVNPWTPNKYYYVASGWLGKLFIRLAKKLCNHKLNFPGSSASTVMPPVTLFAVEAAFGDKCDTVVIDEQIEDIDFNADVDLVCITATTPQANRAYEVSSRFRRRHMPTAIGGIHATVLPEECAQHCDVVCIGEAEGYAGELISDLENNRLEKRYESSEPVSLDSVPFYRYEIASDKYTPFHVINFSRGCSFNCDFCAIQSVFGKYRTRPVAQIVKEIESLGAKNLWFPDGSLTCNPAKTRELLKALVPLRVRWLGQASMNIAGDESMLDLLAESGCWLLSIGFESIDQASIDCAGKPQNKVSDYRRFIRALHQRGIAIEGNFVFGFDTDDVSVFRRTADFIINTGIDIPEIYVLTPYPGTPLFERLKSEGRICDYNWLHYDNTHFKYLPVYQPKRMSKEELRAGCRSVEKAVYSAINTIRRLKNSRVLKPLVAIANFIYLVRMKTRRTLLPFSKERDFGTDHGKWKAWHETSKDE
jgi:radical SAM superfamily enzyme YgiQ (UPF0313 family)